MPNKIEDYFGSTLALEITLASLPSSTTGVGRKAVMVSNTTTRFRDLMILARLKQGASPTGNKSVIFYGIRGDDHATEHISDGLGASNIIATFLNTPVIAVAGNKASPASGDIIYKEFIFHRPGKNWSIGVSHNTGVNTAATAAQSWLRWHGLNPEVQD